MAQPLLLLRQGNTMTECIAYLSDSRGDAEICEWFRHQGCEPRIVHDRDNFVQMLGHRHYARVVFELRRLSDVPVLQTLQTYYTRKELVLIVNPELKAIIDVLRHGTFPIVEDFTELFRMSS